MAERIRGYIMEITSVNNPQIKDYAKLKQKKYRTETGKFILEGYKTIKEAFDFGIKIEKIFVSPSHLKEYSFGGDIVVEANEAVLKKLSSTDSAPEAAAVGFQKKYDTNILQNAQKVILLENIKDVGNLGTIIRSAVAFGTDAIVLYGDCADIYNPKCVRASVGNLWKIPIIHIQELSQLTEIFNDFERIATLPKAKSLLKNLKISLPCLIIFGSEADGLSEDLVKFATNSVKIEMSPNVESLNLASSVSVVLYELFMK